MVEELVKMSSKGQLVVPRRIRKNEKLKPTDRFIAIEIQGGVAFKRITIPKIKEDFKIVSTEVSRHFKKEHIKKEDVGRALVWARKSS